MPEPRRRVSGSDAAGAGALMLAVNLLCTAVGAGVGALIGAPVLFALVGFGIGFGLAIRVIIKRFGDL